MSSLIERKSDENETLAVVCSGGFGFCSIWSSFHIPKYALKNYIYWLE